MNGEEAVNIACDIQADVVADEGRKLISKEKLTSEIVESTVDYDGKSHFFLNLCMSLEEKI